MNSGIPPVRFVAGYAAHLALEVSTPESIAAALNTPETAKWQAAMDFEMASLKDNNVYRVVDRPLWVKVVKCKWVFRVKKNANG